MHEHAPFFFDNWYNVGRAVTLSAVGYGKFLDHALRKERITREEVRAAIRDEGVTRVEDVDAVVLESDGTLTVAWKSKGPGDSSLVDAEVPAKQKSNRKKG